MATARTIPVMSVGSSEISEPQSRSRNLSTVSSATLLTTQSTHYEPFLPPIRQIGANELKSHHSKPSPILSLTRWSQNNLRSKHLSVLDKKKSNDGPNLQSRRKRLRGCKIVLEVVIVLWSLYTLIRYLFAFTIYDSLTGQLATLGLAISTGLSFTFACCAIILSSVQKHLLIRGVSVPALVSVRSVLQYLSFLCFVGPAIANLVFLFLWRDTPNADLSIYHRCKLDIDLVWTITYSLCDQPNYPWGIWICLGVFRIVLSIIIVIAFHVITIPKTLYVRGSKSHKRLHSDYNAGRLSSSKKSVIIPPLSREDPQLGLQHRAAERSLSSNSSPRHRLRSTQSCSSGNSDGVPSYNNTDFLPMGGTVENDSTFMERFRSVVSIISKETEDAIAYARASVGSTAYASQDSAESPTLDASPNPNVESPQSPEYAHLPHYDESEEDDFYASSPVDEVEPDNYHQAYLAEEHIHMMNGIIKRMPTIESMGSRELTSTLGSCGASNHDRNGARPSTRNTRLSWSGTDMTSSDPRRRSLTAQVELLYGKVSASEVGELVKQEEKDKLVDSDSPSAVHRHIEKQDSPLPIYDSFTSGSNASAQSFHTAHEAGSTVNSRKDALDNVPTIDMEIPSEENNT